jgi:hypothetical protein
MTHKWKQSELGHGEMQCEYCLATNREIIIIGDINHCDKAPKQENNMTDDVNTEYENDKPETKLAKAIAVVTEREEVTELVTSVSLLIDAQAGLENVSDLREQNNQRLTIGRGQYMDLMAQTKNTNEELDKMEAMYRGMITAVPE